MRCIGQFKDDRTCDMCNICNMNTYNQCKEDTYNKMAYREKLSDIKYHCPHLTTCYDEYTRFDSCNKNGRGYGRFAEECTVSLECEKYKV